MKPTQKVPATIDEYIADFPVEVRKLLQRVRETIHQAAPEAEEAIKYRLPTFVLHGNLVHFGAFKKHLGLYAMPTAHEKFREELAGYESAKGSVQFPFDRPIPVTLITKMVKFRVKESEEKARAKPKAAKGARKAAKKK